jgi:hypothetical protein
LRIQLLRLRCLPVPGRSACPSATRPGDAPSGARPLAFSASLVLGLLSVSPALAQDGMRYLSWSGKTTNAAPLAAPQRPQPASARYPSIRTPGARSSRYSPSVASGGLTPANAWMNPSPPSQPMGPAIQPPPFQQQALEAPRAFAPSLVPVQARPAQLPGQPVSVPLSALIPQPMPGPHFQQQQRRLQQPQAASGPAWTQPGYAPQVIGHSASSASPQPTLQPARAQPQQQRAPEPMPMPPPSQGGPASAAWASHQAANSDDPAFDPMAPRRDAPIFRIQGAQPPPQQPPPPQNQAQTASNVSSEGPGRNSARFYSLHRAAGLQPDRTELPESVYAVIPESAFFDAARTDLAEPPPPPVQTRTFNGRVQAINPGGNPSLP